MAAWRPLRLTDWRRHIAGAVAVLLLGSATPAAAQGAAEAAGSPTFHLVDQNGRAFTAADLAGKPTVLHFGFTHCPVICPTTLYEIAERLEDLGPDAERIRFVFVTVDPERDTPAVLQAYIETFDRRIVGLSGEAAQVRRLADSVGARYEKIPNKDGGYDMDHTVEAFLLDQHGRRSSLLHVGFGADPKRTLEALRALIAAAR